MKLPGETMCFFPAFSFLGIPMTQFVEQTPLVTSLCYVPAFQLT